uniref:Large ribosomal subunit protein bL28c n=1 Tax=Herposiphonia versicolor TaxID=2007163 RepID=A0A1Z1MF92_9FLOR|nr:ribosomal protein L28 [Herposiphonia versicolor]ARW64747.1 ribosomal protein L28 [Herposiphonia versicolor]
MSKICEISGKKSNNANKVSHSNVKTKKLQHANLQSKRIWSTKKNQWIKLKVSSKIIKSLHKLSI